jgi:NAD(P)-dependent dehydrogenase (short-subunit alcohol dehydrogenase family)
MSIPSLLMAGKVALITGGRTGLGRAFALAFAESGADVAICSRTNEGGKLEAVTDEIRKLGRRALAIKADVSHKTDVENMVKKTVAELGDIDILINNAGISVRSLCLSLLETEEEVWDKVIDINLKGSYLCSQAVGRLMAERKKGVIINIASDAGFKALPFLGVYCISKAGIIMLTRVLARELGSYNIRVNAIAPSVVKTPMTKARLSKAGAVEVESVNYPLGRIGETDDIIGAALFLASDATSWITGHTLLVDGGYLA